MVYRLVQKNFLTVFDVTTAMMVKFICLLLVVCSVHSLQLDSQASTRRPRVTKYSKTTVAPGGSTEAVTERSLNTATYRLLGRDGETCILLMVDALLDISYVTKLNERADANTFVPNNANVAGTCKESDAETLVLTFKDFALEFSFSKTPGGERWYADSLRLTYNSSARILEHAANQGRKVTLSTDSRELLFPTPVGKSYSCPEETVIELAEEDANPATTHRAKLYLREMRLQAFMYKRGGDYEKENYQYTQKQSVLDSTPGGERWYADSLRLTYNSSARILEHAANQGRKVTLSTDSRELLFPTPVGKSYSCPEETVIELAEEDANPATTHRAKLYLREMRLQAFMYKRGGELYTSILQRAYIKHAYDPLWVKLLVFSLYSNSSTSVQDIGSSQWSYKAEEEFRRINNNEYYIAKCNANNKLLRICPPRAPGPGAPGTTLVSSSPYD
uniref:Lysosome-associated membrane glycoprotein 2-like luminal domain-containing protein n=1 Tax=Heliothis virescens TaxID=7102 RepID=A0A2A4KA13_HELVI